MRDQVARAGLWLAAVVKRPLLPGLALLTLSALYLAGPAKDSMSACTAGVILLHLALGLLLIVPVGVKFVRAWRGCQASSNETSESSPNRMRRLGLELSGVFSLLSAVTGLMLALRAALGISVAHDVLALRLHVLSSFGGLALVGFWCWRRRKSQRHSYTQRPAFQMNLMLVGMGLLCAATVSADYRPDVYFKNLVATNPRQAGTSFFQFPAGTQLAEGATQDTLRSVPSDAYCGRNGCHVAAYDEWLPSAHHFAGEDVAYRRVVREYAAKSGPEATRWCTGCHEPLATMGAGSNASFADSSQGHKGVGCVACHATVGVEHVGNGHLTLSAPENYPFAVQQKGWTRALHDFLLRVRPGPHQRAYLKPALHRSAEFCGGCHRQNFNVSQNHYQFVHGPDEYGNWQSGGASGQVARSANLISVSTQTCQECHFRRDLTGHISHASPGSNTALPALRGDWKQAHGTEAFLQQSRIALDLFCLRRSSSGSEAHEEWIAPLDALTSANGLRPSETVLIDIIVSNRVVGHSFPAGYEDIKDAWLEVTMMDATGSILAESGVVRSATQPLPPDTHAWRQVALDRSGQPLLHHELTEQVTTAYRRFIAPGSSDIARYRLTVPKFDAKGKPLSGSLRLRARLRYRQMRPDFAGWVTEAAEPPSLPITTMAEVSTHLPVQGASINGLPPSLPDAQSALNSGILFRRYLDYGMGLLAPIEGPKLPEALRAFRAAHELLPDRFEPLLGLGRAYLRELDLPSARAHLEQALRIAPDNAAIRAELGVVYRKQGDYDRALALLRPLAEQFPKDVALQFDLGLTLVNVSDYANAARSFQRALDVDPDDAAAHFQLMRCWQHLKRVPEARREEAIGRYLAEDRMAPRLLPTYLREHPDARQAIQAIPVHLLNPAP